MTVDCSPGSPSVDGGCRLRLVDADDDDDDDDVDDDEDDDASVLDWSSGGWWA